MWLIAIGLFGASVSGKTQIEVDEREEEESPINVFKIESGNYFQNGNHSAVTGGIGTEKLQVYANKFTFSKIQPGKNIFTVNTGIDIISSPSTDAIDSNVSSASLVDYRSYLGVGYDQNLSKDVSVGISAAMSIESDYLSFPVKLNMAFTNPQETSTLKLGLNMYFDDLRWGRLNFGLFDPRSLVYPAELRNTEWHDQYLRQTYDLNISLEQVINQRSNIAFLIMASLQKGLLSTPFHRVYFKDDDVRVENLPSSRFKIPLGIKWNYFLGDNSILKVDGNLFWDDFGINAQSIHLEFVHYISRFVNIKPHLKYYRQSGSKYFQPYLQHDPDSEFYTSDYDLAKANSFSVGIAFRIFKDNTKKNKIQRNDYEFRYAYFHRSDALNSHILTMILTFSNQK